MRIPIIFMSVAIMLLMGGCYQKPQNPNYPHTSLDKAVNAMLKNAEMSVRDGTDSGVRVKQDIKSYIVSNDQQSYVIRAENYTTKETVTLKCDLISNGSDFGIDCIY